MTKTASKQELSFKEAERFFQQGNLVQALKCYRQLDLDCKHSNDLIAQRIRDCLKQLLRKYWRQQKTEQMAQIMKELGIEQELALCYARLLGKATIAQIAAQANGIQAKLAQCSLQEDLKSALLSLRQLPELKTIAEGWLALLKGDRERALISFDQAETQTPVYAKIGKGIVYLIEGNMQKANLYLENLKPFASVHFPILHKEMEWGQELNEAKKSQFSSYLFSASLEELQEAERQLSPQQTKMKGWLWLRIGDCLASKSPEKALIAWEKAKRLNPNLILDELKRRFLLSQERDCSINSAAAFEAFYRKLVNLTPQNAKEFVEYLVFENISSVDFLEVKHLKHDGKWMVQPPPLELQLLWFHVFYLKDVHPILQLLFIIPEFNKHLLSASWEEWDSIFQVLDVEYGKRESYLRQKLGIACVYEQDQIIRSVIVQLLQLNAMLKDELLPLYVQKTLPILLAKSTTIEEKKGVAREIEKLRYFWAHDYDLIRLSILTNVSHPSPIDLVSHLGVHLSEPLRKVLQLQVTIDQGETAVDCRKLLPDSSLYKRDPEADWRLLAAVFDPAFKMPHQELENMLSLLVSDTASKHALFSKIELYGVHPPFFLLKHWQQATWEPYYHAALCYGFKKSFGKALSALRKAHARISENAKEASSIERTLWHYLEFSILGNLAAEVIQELLEESSDR